VDIDAIVPAVERALTAIGLTGLDPADVYALTADALADVLLYTGSVFGAKLIVTERDSTTQAPTKYATDRLLTPEEESVIRSQAALNRMFIVLSTSSISERIADEAQSWEVTRSAQVIRDQLKLLVDERNRALEALERQGAALDSYESYIATTDAYVSARVEPWINGGAFALGGGLERDYRFA